LDKELECIAGKAFGKRRKKRINLCRKAPFIFEKIADLLTGLSARKRMAEVALCVGYTFNITLCKENR